MTSINRNVKGDAIGDRDGWRLFKLYEKSSDAWVRLKLIHMTARRGQLKKRAFAFTHNGQRFALSRDITLLRALYPDLYDWVIECIWENMPGDEVNAEIVKRVASAIAAAYGNEGELQSIDYVAAQAAMKVLSREQGSSLKDKGLYAERLRGVAVGQGRGDLIGGPSKMASLLLESVYACGSFNRDDVARGYLDWWKAEGYDTGPIAAEVFDIVVRDGSIDDAVRQVDAANNGMTAGCAPMHRNVVLASVPFIADGDLEECVRRETSLTHHHPLAADCSVAAVRIARQLTRGADWNDALATAGIGLSNLVIAAIEGWRSEPVERTGYSPVVLHGALHFVGTSSSFDEALGRSIEFSGEDNYVSVLAGAFAGALWGCADNS